MVMFFGNLAGLGALGAGSPRIDPLPLAGGNLAQSAPGLGQGNPLASFFDSPLFGASNQDAMGQFGSFFSMLFMMLFSRMGQFGMPANSALSGLPLQNTAPSESNAGGNAEVNAGGGGVAAAPESGESAAGGANEPFGAANQPATFTPSTTNGVSVSSPLIQVQDSASTAVSIRQLPGSENGSRHHIYVKILDASGNPVDGQVELINANGDRHVIGNGGNMPMWKNDNYTIRYNGTEIRGVDSHSGTAEPGSEWGHQSYEIVFKEKSGNTGGNSPEGNPPESGKQPDPKPENDPPTQNA